MVNILFDYLRQKAEAVGFVSKAYAQAVRVTRRDGDNNTVSFPAVFENGELKQLSFDAYDSLVFFMLDGEVERTTEAGEISSAEDQITETYKAKAYFFHSGKEISDCASFAQQATYSLAKYICADNDQLETELNLQSVSIIAESLQFLKEEIWNELHSGIELKLSEKHQLCSIAFEIEISGVESCFVNDPCELGEFSWEFSTQSSCEVIAQCLETPGNGGVFPYASYGNGTDTVTISALIGRTLLTLTTDGIGRNFNPAFTPTDALFTSSTGTLVFAGAVDSESIISGLYK